MVVSCLTLEEDTGRTDLFGNFPRAKHKVSSNYTDRALRVNSITGLGELVRMVVVPSDGVGSGVRVSHFSDFVVLGPENGTKYTVGNIERWVTDTFGTNHLRTPCHCFG